MTIVFFIIVTLFLMVVQTVLFPSLMIFTQCFDLLIIDVLCLSLISNRLSVIFAIVLIGAIMDSISGVPFFYYIFSYTWIFIIVQLVKQFLFKKSFFFILILSVISVIIQQGLLLFSLFVQQDAAIVMNFNYLLLAKQILWGSLFIPAGVFLLQILLDVWIRTVTFLQKQMAKNLEWYVD